MKKFFKLKATRIALCALFSVLIIAGVFPITAFAAEGDGTLSFDPSIPEANGSNTFSFKATLEVAGAVPPANVNIALSTDSTSPVIDTRQSTPVITGQKAEVTVTGTFNPELNAGVYNVTVKAYYTVSGAVKTATATLPVRKGMAPTATPLPTSTPQSSTAIVLSAVDSKGNALSVPAGNYGDKITLTVPVRNRGGYITEFDLRMEVGTDTANFPFDMSGVSYVRRMPDMLSNGVIDAVYNLRLSPTVTKGVKAVNFTASYKKNGIDEESKFTVYVNVVKGAPEPTPVASGIPGSAAKLIVSGYKTNPERLMAGEPFDLELTFENTSDKEEVSNIKITLKNEDGVIIPAASGSNTLYIRKIGVQQKATEVVKLQSRPDAAAKPYTLSVAIEYQSANSPALTATEAITLVVAQKMRVVIEDPRVMSDGATVETPVSVSFSVFNMGKAPLYNLMIDVEGEGLRMEEKFFGGTVAAGSASRADFNVVPSTAGPVNATLIITYENEYGEQTKEEKPISFEVMDNAPMPMEGQEGEMMIGPDGKPIVNKPAQGGFRWLYVGIGGGVLVIALIVFLVIRRRKKAKEFTDVDL